MINEPISIPVKALPIAVSSLTASVRLMFILSSSPFKFASLNWDTKSKICSGEALVVDAFLYSTRSSDISRFKTAGAEASKFKAKTKSKHNILQKSTKINIIVKQ